MSLMWVWVLKTYFVTHNHDISRTLQAAMFSHLGKDSNVTDVIVSVHRVHGSDTPLPKPSATVRDIWSRVVLGAAAIHLQLITLKPRRVPLAARTDREKLQNFTLLPCSPH